MHPAKHPLRWCHPLAKSIWMSVFRSLPHLPFGFDDTTPEVVPGSQLSLLLHPVSQSSQSHLEGEISAENLNIQMEI